MLIELLERFWAKVDKRGPDECWPWIGGRDGKGYGRLLRVNRKHTRGWNNHYSATHVSLAIAGVRRPSEAHMALHSCDNPPCVNPAHLRWGTHAENMDDKTARNRHRLSPKRRAAYEKLDARAGQFHSGQRRGSRE